MGALLSSSRRARVGHRRPYYRRVATTRDFDTSRLFSQPQRAHSQLDQDLWTCENNTYRYPIDESLNDPWERCYDVVNKSDEDLCTELKSEISDLLVVAGLFLGIVTAFTIESFKWLIEDQEQASTQLLVQVVRLLNDTAARGTATPLPNFKPNNHEVVVNQLWFLSMTLSLSAVIVGTLCLQWLSAFRSTGAGRKPYDEALALRELRFQGLVDWGVPRVPAILLLTVQGALVLFAIGLLYLLWNINTSVALPVAIVSGVSVALLTLTTAMPLLQSAIGWIFPSTLVLSQCPYKSPISWVTHRGCVLLAILCSLPFSWLPCIRKKMSIWRAQQLSLLTDYLWHKHDEIWRQQRESWGPQSSRLHSKKYSYYLVHGLASAMKTLVFQPNAVHIIHKCLQEFHMSTAEVETFEELFGKDFTSAEEALLVWNNTAVADSSELGGCSPAYIQNLRKDFLNAQALQHFVVHNQKLHRILLPHRVELYIRIKNSSPSEVIFDGQGTVLEQEGSPSTSAHRDEDDHNSYIGLSIECPIHNPRDAQSLTPDLRDQFLKSAANLIDTPQFREADALGAALVLRASIEDQFCASGTHHDAADSSIDHQLDDQLHSKQSPLLENLPTTAAPTFEVPVNGNNTPPTAPDVHDVQERTALASPSSPKSNRTLYDSVRKKLATHYRETSESVFGHSDADSDSQSPNELPDTEKSTQRGEDMA